MLIRTARHARIAAVVTAVGVLACSCATPEQSQEISGSGVSAAASRYDPAAWEAAVAAASQLAGKADLGGSIEIIGGDTGFEADILTGVYKAFEAGTGARVNYTGTGSGSATATTVSTRVKGGKAPDVAQINIGVAREYAAQNQLVDLTEVVGQQALAANFSEPLLAASSYDGKVMGIFQNFSTFAMWYNPEAYTGPQAGVWDDVVTWTDKNSQAGKVTWCMGLEAGAGSGFPAAQLIEQIFAKRYGPDLLAKWGNGQLAWTSPEVKWAWEQFGLISTDSSVNLGLRGAISQSVTDGPVGLVSDPVQCEADVWGSWVPGIIGDKAQAGKNLDFMPLPGADPKYANTEIFQATISVAFNPTEQVKAFMKYLASFEAQNLLATGNQWTVADKLVATEVYANPLLRKAAKHYFADDTVLAVGPNMLASAEVGNAFNKGVIAYLSDKGSLDTVLDSIQSALS